MSPSTVERLVRCSGMFANSKSLPDLGVVLTTPGNVRVQSNEQTAHELHHNHRSTEVQLLSRGSAIVPTAGRISSVLVSKLVRRIVTE